MENRSSVIFRRIFVISDTHFCHRNIINYCGRPFQDVEQMNEEMVRLWNFYVGADDIVIHCGDFAFGDMQNIVKWRDRLNGHIILILGNHDKKRYNYIDDAGFDAVFFHEHLFKGGVLFCHSLDWVSSATLSEADFVYYGHVHDKDANPISKNHRNVCVEWTGYAPLDITDNLPLETYNDIIDSIKGNL